MIQGRDTSIQLFKPGNVLLCKFHHEDCFPVRQQPLEMRLRHDFNMRLKHRWFSLGTGKENNQNIFSRFSQFALNLLRNHPIVDRVLSEVQKGYDLLILEIETGCKEFAYPHLDSVIRLAPCPTIAIFNSDIFPTGSSQQLLIYMDDSPASQRAFEVGLVLGAEDAPPPIVLSTLAPSAYGYQSYFQGEGKRIEAKMEKMRQLRNIYGMDFVSEIKVSESPEESILDLAQTANVETLILGTNLQAGSTRKYLGPMVKHLAQQERFQVIVVNSFE
jgi:nucleotide-binding universal stress UspA family protein